VGIDEFLELLGSLVEDDNASNLQGLLVGRWSAEGDSSEPVIEALVANRAKLPNLRAIFLGDLVLGTETGYSGYEPLELVWIHHGDFARLLEAFPGLEHLYVRGAPENAYSHGKSVPGPLGALASDSLRSLAFGAGIEKWMLAPVLAARLPALEHLELWCGWNRGSAVPEDFAPLFSGELFPKLRYLGLRDDHRTDAVATLLAKSPILERLRVLDLSLGTLGDPGAEALLGSPATRRLERLVIRHHFVRPELVKKLEALGIELDEGDAQQDTPIPAVR
jgi:hypothetical protein